MIAAKMNTTPTLVFDYDNSKLKNRKKVKIMCENYCLDLDTMPKVLQTLDGVTDQVCYQGFAPTGACDAERLHEDRQIVDGA